MGLVWICRPAVEPLNKSCTRGLLGVTIDEELTFKKHVDQLCKKISLKIGLLNKMRIYLPIRERELFYNALINRHYYLFKISFQFWLAKSTRIIHHNQLLITKFGRILCLTRKWRQKCSPLQVKAPLPRRPGDEVELFWLWKQEWRTVHSFQE